VPPDDGSISAYEALKKLRPKDSCILDGRDWAGPMQLAGLPEGGSLGVCVAWKGYARPGREGRRPDVDVERSGARWHSCRGSWPPGGSASRRG